MKPSLAFRAAACVLFLGSVSATALADDPYNYAEVWRGWSGEAKTAYLWGLMNGVSRTYILAASNWLSNAEWGSKNASSRVNRVREAAFLQFEEATLIPVMTDLYRDPANAFIEFPEIAEAARDKLRGSDVQARLLRARKFAIETHEFNERLRANKGAK